MVATRSAPQEAHYHVDVFNMPPSQGMKRGARSVWYSELGLHKPTNILYTLVDSTPRIVEFMHSTKSLIAQEERLATIPNR